MINELWSLSVFFKKGDMKFIVSSCLIDDKKLRFSISLTHQINIFSSFGMNSRWKVNFSQNVINKNHMYCNTMCSHANLTASISTEQTDKWKENRNKIWFTFVTRNLFSFWILKLTEGILILNQDIISWLIFINSLHYIYKVQR